MSEEVNPFAELEKQVKRDKDSAAALKAVEASKIRMMAGRVKGVSGPSCVFFSTLMMKLKFKEEWDKTKTLCTDGEWLLYNPEYVVKLGDLEAGAGALAHEVLHCALLHQSRREMREPGRWNLACDLVVNPLLREAGFKLLPDAPFPGEGKHAKLPAGKSEEQYYELLKEPEKPKDDRDGDDPNGSLGGAGVDQQAGPGPGQGKGDGGPGPGGGGAPVPDPGGCGSVTEPTGNGAAQAKSNADWKVNVAQAGQGAQAEAARTSQGKGDMPAWMKRLVGQATQPKIAWQDVLREFVTKAASNDYDWSRPNRRLMAAEGVYLPRLHSVELGELVVFVDTSGSIGQEVLDKFAAEIQGILDDFPGSQLKIVYHDAQVYPEATQEWTPEDGPLVMKPVGGGGTDHCPCFEWLKAAASSGEAEPVCVVFLTDMMSSFPEPEEAPETPVLWCKVGTWKCHDPGFGQILEIDE